MFDPLETGIGLLPGESHEDVIAYETTCLASADGWDEPDRHLLPAGFEQLPIHVLAVLVAHVDRSRLNGHDAVRLMQVEARLESSFAAGKLASMAEVAHSPVGDAESPVERSPNEIEYAACEIAAALTLTRQMSQRLLEEALTLTGPLSRVWARFRAGDIDSVRVRRFIGVLGHLSSEVIDQVLDRCLDIASELTSGQLGARLNRLALEADPAGVAHSMQRGLEDRKVASSQNPDLTGNLGIYNSNPLDVAEAMANLDRIARDLKTSNEPRSLDQLRSDVALDLLKGTVFSGRTIGAPVIVTIPAATLERGAAEPGFLEGFGPVTAEIARKTVVENIDGRWEFQVTDNGQAVATGTLSRRPNAAQKRRIRVLYPTCVFPGCRQPSYNCDLDHRKPVSQGGATHNDNLGPLCRHHHMVRHHSPWLLEREPDGDHVWTSPLGFKYIRRRGPPEES
jgi:hypothetical protein